MARRRTDRLEPRSRRAVKPEAVGRTVRSTPPRRMGGCPLVTTTARSRPATHRPGLHAPGRQARRARRPPSEETRTPPLTAACGYGSTPAARPAVFCARPGGRRPSIVLTYVAKAIRAAVPTRAVRLVTSLVGTAAGLESRACGYCRSPAIVNVSGDQVRQSACGGSYRRSSGRRAPRTPMATSPEAPGGLRNGRSRPGQRPTPRDRCGRSPAGP